MKVSILRNISSKNGIYIHLRTAGTVTWQLIMCQLNPTGNLRNQDKNLCLLRICKNNNKFINKTTLKSLTIIYGWVRWSTLRWLLSLSQNIFSGTHFRPPVDRQLCNPTLFLGLPVVENPQVTHTKHDQKLPQHPTSVKEIILVKNSQLHVSNNWTKQFINDKALTAMTSPWLFPCKVSPWCR